MSVSSDGQTFCCPASQICQITSSGRPRWTARMAGSDSYHSAWLQFQLTYGQRLTPRTIFKSSPASQVSPTRPLASHRCSLSSTRNTRRYPRLFSTSHLYFGILDLTRKTCLKRFRRDELLSSGPRRRSSLVPCHQRIMPSYLDTRR